jgi:hypothetical protein
MKKFERIMYLVIAGAMVMDYFRIDGNDIIFILSASSLALYYFVYSYFLFNNKRIFKKTGSPAPTAKRIAISIAMGWALSATLMGFLFRFMFWDGWYFQLRVGLVFLAALSIAPLIFYLKHRSSFLKGILIRAGLVGVLGVLAFSISNVQLIKWKYSDCPDCIEAAIKLDQDPSNKELLKEYENICYNTCD